MESIKSLAIVLLLSGCVHTDSFVKPDPIPVLVDVTMLQPCQPLPTDVQFYSFNDVLDQKALETTLYINCSSKTEKLQATLKRLDNVKIIRLVTPESTDSRGDADTASE